MDELLRSGDGGRRAQPGAAGCGSVPGRSGGSGGPQEAYPQCSRASTPGTGVSDAADVVDRRRDVEPARHDADPTAGGSHGLTPFRLAHGQGAHVAHRLLGDERLAR